MTRLSREQIAALRDLLRGGGRPSRLACNDLLIVLDAYEAQRPRPASEAPEEGARCLCLLEYEQFGSGDREWVTADYRDGAWEIDFDLARAGLIAWLPLPPAPERDDG